MSGRFPADIFTIIIVPFIVIALGVFLSDPLIPNQVLLSVGIAIAVAFVWSTIVVVRRRKRR
jgi:hypothetical protein